MLKLQALLDEDDGHNVFAEQLNVDQALFPRRLKAMGKIISKVGRWVPHELVNRHQENRNYGDNSGHMAREASLHPISEKYIWNDCGLYPASIKPFCVPGTQTETDWGLTDHYQRYKMPLY
ncbi:hypothetical protein TNCV_148201 [Trichonephila clavipes]|nr:hypothetical protein TNCV_148201 [Trichonephila clavipes]